MSDANAVAVLAALTSWYPLYEDLTDAHGSNDLDTGVTEAYEAGGKVSGDRLAAGSAGTCTLAASMPVTATTGNAFVGGWAYYTGSSPGHAEFGLGFNLGVTNEFLTISSGSGTFKVFGWHEGAGDFYHATDPNIAGLAYPFTVRVEDSLGSVATSNQNITIRDPLNPLPEGWYFVVGQWNEGVPSMWVNGELVATGTAAPSVRASPVTLFLIGNHLDPDVTQAALSEVFFGTGANLTQAQIEYLYNAGVGKSYANVTADAA